MKLTMLNFIKLELQKKFHLIHLIYIENFQKADSMMKVIMLKILRKLLKILGMKNVLKEMRSRQKKNRKNYHKKFPKKLKMKKTEELPNDVLLLKKLIVSYLKEGEHVLQALRRLKSLSNETKKDKQKENKEKHNKEKENEEMRNKENEDKDKDQDQDQDKDKDKQKNFNMAHSNEENNLAFNLLTEAADLCLQNFSCYNIYHETREEISISIQQENANPPSYWEYKLNEESNDIYGPFITSEMLTWYNQGYFQGDGVVLIRRVGSQETFQLSDTVDFTIYL